MDLNRKIKAVFEVDTWEPPEGFLGYLQSPGGHEELSNLLDTSFKKAAAKKGMPLKEWLQRQVDALYGVKIMRMGDKNHE